MRKYLFFWLKMTSHLSQVAFASRFGAILFTFGKIIRFVFFLIFLLVIMSKTNTLGGFTIWQVILFFLTFNLIDTISQFLWRDVYRFRSYIISGSFDLILTKPISPLFRALFGGSDILDLFTLIPLLVFLGFVMTKIGPVDISQMILYVLLIINGLIISLSFHIFVLSLGIVTTEVDNAIWMFREVIQLGKYPLTVFPRHIGTVFTYLIPVAAMITFPTHALLGLLTIQGVMICVFFSCGLLLLSLYSWRGALRQYASASS